MTDNTKYAKKIVKMLNSFETSAMYLKDKWLEKTYLHKYLTKTFITLSYATGQWYKEDEIKIQNTIEYVYRYVFREYLKDITEIRDFDISNSALDLKEPKDICNDELFEIEEDYSNPMKEYAFIYIHLTKVLEDITVPLWIQYNIDAKFVDENMLQNWRTINMINAEK